MSFGLWLIDDFIFLFVFFAADYCVCVCVCVITSNWHALGPVKIVCTKAHNNYLTPLYVLQHWLGCE